MLGQTIGGTLCRSCLKVIEISILLLIIGEPVPHMIQNLLRKFLCPLIRHVCTKPVGIQTNLIHPDQANRGKVILEGSQVPFRIWIQSFIQKLCDDFPLDL